MQKPVESDIFISSSMAVFKERSEKTEAVPCIHRQYLDLILEDKSHYTTPEEYSEFIWNIAYRLKEDLSSKSTSDLLQSSPELETLIAELINSMLSIVGAYKDEKFDDKNPANQNKLNSTVEDILEAYIQLITSDKYKHHFSELENIVDPEDTLILEQPEPA